MNFLSCFVAMKLWNCKFEMAFPLRHLEDDSKLKMAFSLALKLNNITNSTNVHFSNRKKVLNVKKYDTNAIFVF